ncbi:MAG: sensor histidine kinase, partial [Candidatus Zipacnadales bacterium]
LYLAHAEGSPRASVELLLARAVDRRCVVAESLPGGITAPDAVQARAIPVENLVNEYGIVRRVAPRLASPDDLGRGGFMRALTTQAVAGHPRATQPSARIEENLRRLNSPHGMLIDYSLQPSPVHRVSLESLAQTPPASLRRVLLGSVVLLSAIPMYAEALNQETGRTREPAVAWAIATALAGSGAREALPEIVGAVLVLLGVLLMLIMGDRGLRGKFIAGLVTLLAAIGGFALALASAHLFIPFWPIVTLVLAAFGVSTCLELGEAGSLIEQESRSESGGPPWAGDYGRVRPEAAVEETLRSIVEWHQLPGAALLLRDSARPAGLVHMGADGVAHWENTPPLEALGQEALQAKAPVIGDWPNSTHKALAVPVIIDRTRAVALIMAAKTLPLPPEIVQFATRVTRQLLLSRTARPDVSLTVLNSADRPDKLPLPAQVARLRASRHRRQQRTALAAAWRAGPHEAVVVFDTSGRPILWNRRAETLFDGAEGLDLSQTHLVPLLARATEQEEAEVRQIAMGVLLHGTPYISDIEDPKARCNYVASLTRVGSDPEAPNGLALRCIDVTGVCRPARVEARLMSVAAHEMRTPLTSILGYAELLQDRLNDPTLARYALAIQRQARRVEAIVGELLTVTRLEAGREEIQIEPVDMVALCHQVVAAARPIADAKRISLSVTCSGDTVLRGDVRKLERLVENLVTNAIKYSPEEASVHVNVQQQGENIVTQVIDTGYGIAPEDLPHVFEKFYRAKNAHTASVEGTGLGLAIARLIAEAHGGTIRLDSVVGTGSTFTVTLPIAGPPAKSVSTPAA